MTTIYTLPQRRSEASSVLHKDLGPITPDISRNTASIARVVRTALENLAKSADNPRARTGARTQSPNVVVASLDWEGFVDDMQPVAKYMAETIRAFGRREVPGVVRKAAEGVDVSFAFEAVDDLSVAFATQRTGQLIVEITQSTKDSVIALVLAALQGNLTVDQVARRLRDDIPLTPGDTAAVDRYFAKQFERLLEEGNTLDKASSTATRLADTLAKKKLRQRAETIARTELIMAANQGRYTGWKASVGTGLAPAASVKEWIAAPGACEQCAALDGLLAPWDGTFPNGLEMPPDHPRCRCTAVLLPPDRSILADMERQFDSAAGDSPLDRIRPREDRVAALHLPT